VAGHFHMLSPPNVFHGRLIVGGFGGGNLPFSLEQGSECSSYRPESEARRDLGVRLSTDGEDAGRLVEVTDGARSELTQRMVGAGG